MTFKTLQIIIFWIAKSKVWLLDIFEKLNSKTFVIKFMEKIIDFPRATGTRHLPKEDQDKKKDELHEFLVHGET